MTRNPDEAFVATLETMSLRLAQLEQVSGRPGPWKFPTLLNSWADYNATDAGFQKTRYRREGADVVRIEMMVRAGTVNNPAFVLPTGYRPLLAQLFVGLDGAGVGQRLSVLANGNVVPVAGNTTFWAASAVFTTS